MKYIIYTLLLTGSFSVYGQKFTGKIVDSEKQPIPGAHVFFHKTEKHAHSNLFGVFNLEGVVTGDTLVISHVGYEGRSVIVKNPAVNLTITLNEQTTELSEVTITPNIDAINLFTKLDLSVSPVNSSQEVLRKVPGLVIGQHAGGGKAEQIFLRGFDIDHGTDINITVDGLPANLVSHAHGQGYSDLHFLIPETIEKIDFGKGPYYAHQGNFATAGYVAFQTKDRLANSNVQVEYGQFNTIRTLGLFNIANTNNQSAYIAADYRQSDGPFDSPQNFDRINLMGKYSVRMGHDDRISILLSRFTSKWDASGQIPQRLVNDGTIGFYGAVDDTEGGITGRTNVKIDYKKILDGETFVKNSIYFSKYDFELYSNFTFFLNDPVNGDQIKQKEDRRIFGASSEWNKNLELGANDILFKAGIGFRNDRINGLELSRSVNRTTTLENIQLGDVVETNMYSYASADIELGKWLFNPGFRVDYFNFKYSDATLSRYQTLSANKATISPKLNVLFNQSENIQFYLKTGIGFHSNDTRVVVANNGKDILPSAYGSDLGLIWKPTRKMLINTALWTLYSQQEFVYVGDEGIVEPNGRSRRSGVDIGIRYQLARWFYFNSDINYAYSRLVDNQSENNRIPLAPEVTATGGLSISNYNGWSGNVSYRIVRDRPANEDNSIIAEGYSIIDLNVTHQFDNVNIGFSVENVFNSQWKETQFASESRLLNESEGVEEIHFTPGTPFFIKFRANIKF